MTTENTPAEKSTSLPVMAQVHLCDFTKNLSLEGFRFTHGESAALLDLAGTLNQHLLGESETQGVATTSELLKPLFDRCVAAFWTEECNTSDLAIEEFNRNRNKLLQAFNMDYGTNE